MLQKQWHCAITAIMIPKKQRPCVAIQSKSMFISLLFLVQVTFHVLESQVEQVI